MILLVLDLVGDLNEIDLARGAITSTIAELPRNVYAGVLRAQDGLSVLVDPTDDRDAVINAVDTFGASGTPGLLESIETVSNLADSVLRKAPVRIAVCYISDADVEDYREDFSNPVINYSDSRDLSRRFPEGLVRERISKLSSKLAAAQAPIFIVQLKSYSDRLNEAYQAGLLQLATATGGEAVFCRSNSEIPVAIEQVLRRIAGHYSVDLQVAGKEGENVAISLESPAGPLTYRTKVQIGKGAEKQKQ